MRGCDIIEVSTDVSTHALSHWLNRISWNGDVIHIDYAIEHLYLLKHNVVHLAIFVHGCRYMLLEDDKHSEVVKK